MVIVGLSRWQSHQWKKKYAQTKRTKKLKRNRNQFRERDGKKYHKINKKHRKGILSKPFAAAYEKEHLNSSAAGVQYIDECTMKSDGNAKEKDYTE